LPFIDLYVVRHSLSGLIGLLGIFFAYLIVKDIAGWRAAIICVLIFALSPRYVGHVLNNPKDGPFAAFYVMSLWGIFNLIRKMPKPTLKDMILSGICIGLPFSVRAGGFLTFAYFGLFMGIEWLLRHNLKPFSDKALKEIPPFARVLIIAGIAGYVIGIILWPYALIAPFSNPFKALTEFSNFSTQIMQVYDGMRIMSNNLPPEYIFNWMWMTIPTVVIAGFFLSPLTIFKNHKQYEMKFIGFVAFALVFPIAYILYKDSNLYGGWRHVLFVYPPFVILAAIGWDGLVRMLKKPTLQYAVIGAIGVLSLYPLQWMVLQAPHYYVFFNVVNGGLQKAHGQYETDYYLNSIRPLTEWFMEEVYDDLDKSEQVVVRSNKLNIMVYYLPEEDIESETLKAGYLKYRTRSQRDWDYFIHTSGYIEPVMLRNGAWPPDHCIYVEKAAGVPLGAVIKRPSKDDLYGFQALKRNQVDSAIYFFEKYVALDQSNEFVLANLANAYLAKQDAQKAYEYAQQTIALQPNNPTALDVLMRLAVAGIQPQQILATFNQIANDLPGDHTGNFYLGQYYQNAGDI
jgi:tetratricopeptide (TPR) repeat protein